MLVNVALTDVRRWKYIYTVCAAVTGLIVDAALTKQLVRVQKSVWCSYIPVTQQ